MLSMNAMDLYGNVGFVLISWWGGRNYLVFTSLIRNQVENPLTEICMCLLKYR